MQRNMTPLKKAHAELAASIMAWLDVKDIYMSPQKKADLVRLILRVDLAAYSNGYFDGEQQGRSQCKEELMECQRMEPLHTVKE